MNVYALSMGILTALITIKLFNGGKAHNIQALYALYLGTFPFYYWLFAVYGAYSTVLLKEILAGLPFMVLAWFCLKLNSKDYPLLLAAGYILHAIYAFYHSNLFVNPGAPTWWPEFCGVIELILGIYIATFIFVRSIKKTAVHSYGR